VGLDDRYPGKRDDSDAYADYHKRENRELGLRQTWGTIGPVVIEMSISVIQICGAAVAVPLGCPMSTEPFGAVYCGQFPSPEPHPPRKQSTASVKLLVTHITCQGCALRQRAPVAQPGRYHNQPRALPWYDPLKKAKVTSSNLVRGSTPSSVPHYPYSSSFLENPLPFNPSL